MRAASHSLPFFRDPFRPFYLGGALWAALAVPAWLGMWFHGYFTPSLTPLLWHAHEMIFGFAASIIVGFLFTAARRWTGLGLPVGAPLAALFALWLAARVGMAFAYGMTTAILDVSLLPIVASTLAWKFVRARSWTNLPLVVVLLSLSTANAAFHCSMLGYTALSPLDALESGLFLVITVELLIGGRIIPAFTSNGSPGGVLFHSPWLYRPAVAMAVAALALTVFRPGDPWTGRTAIAAAGLVAIQALGWNPLATRGRPMLWILHASFAWIPVGLLLLGLSAFGLVSRSAGIHALAAGSVGGLIMGMVTRTALGHSGRAIQAGRVERVAFALVISAAVIRVSVALTEIHSIYLWGMLAAGMAWCAAYLTYAIGYWRLLCGSPAPVRAPRFMNPTMIPATRHANTPTAE